MAKILIVEDSPVDQLLIKRLLVRPDWVSQIASNGKEALELIGKLRPDIVVTDLQMPVMDGLELVKAVRENDAGLPIVLVTAKGSEQTAVDALRDGATSYSPKSKLSTDLVSTIEQVLEMSRRMRYSHDSEFFPTPKSHAVVLKNDLKLIGPTIENMQSQLPAWSDRDRLQIGMALDEALVNAMHHGNLEVDSTMREGDETNYYELIRVRQGKPPWNDRKVRVEFEFSDQHICIQVSDEGSGFDPATIPDPRTPENLHRVCGRGLFLIRNFMDQVAHNATGNQITMTKLREK
ncbi:ATP-binding response regulator [Mariniblastus fucicola]|uniref:Regulatory protein LuxO n=1 Tax=Mariniblastus fucicola TaxID=980251 RepID=A0A5B9P3W5_9BACT|nr:response regulator [Mariniblastus fucicola]QEG20169.1 Regulatory protein LuxO [Mariniblastus fucicola]